MSRRRGRGGDPGARCQRAGEGQAAPLRRAPAPGGSALAEAVGAGGGGRARQGGKGGERRGDKRGSTRGGAPGPGEGLGAAGRGLQPSRRGRAGRRAPAEPRARSAAWRGPGPLLGGPETPGGIRGRRGGGGGQLAPTQALRLGTDFCLFVPTFPCPSYSYPPDLFSEK